MALNLNFLSNQRAADVQRRSCPRPGELAELPEVIKSEFFALLNHRTLAWE